MRFASTRAGAHKLLPLGDAVCGCRWVWFVRKVNGAYSPLGCVRHSSAGSAWTRRTRSFRVVPELEPCGYAWSGPTWCQRGGGVFSQHVCSVVASDRTQKNCRCACGAEE